MVAIAPLAAAQVVWERHTVTDYDHKLVETADMDGDGEDEMVSVNGTRTKVFIGPYEVIQANDYIWALDTGDADDDGDLDIFLSSDAGVSWFEQQGDWSEYKEHPIRKKSGEESKNMAAGDFDGDLDVDISFRIVAGSYSYQFLYENDGNGTFTKHQMMQYYGPRNMESGDVYSADPGEEIVSTMDGNVYWQGSTLRKHKVWGNGASDLAIADINGDGTQDILAGGGWKLVWYQNLEESWERHEIGTLSEQVAAADINGDTSTDVLGTENGDLAWYENTVTGFSKNPIDNNGVVDDMATGDGDDDGRPDLALVEDTTAWYENHDNETSTIRGTW